MALLWCDGFDHYGTSARMTDGPYAEVVSSSFALSTTNPRTGTYCMRKQGVLTLDAYIRRVLGGSKTTVGLGLAVYMDHLPFANDAYCLYDFRDAGNVPQISVVVQSTGTIAIKRGTAATGGGNTSTTLGTTSVPVVTANAYQHIETAVFFSNTVGTVEVRVNGVTVLSLTGVDTVYTANVECSQVAVNCGCTGLSIQHFVTSDIDDIFCWDTTGSYNNTFIGDRRVLTLFPDANTATADWTAVGAASGYLCIDEANPNDDTDYISAATVGQVSQFGLQNLPSGISVVSAVVMVERARKTDAGTANTKVSVVSGASSAAGADKPLTEIYTYRQDVFQTDPVSAAPFTPADVNALQFKVERTA